MIHWTSITQTVRLQQPPLTLLFVLGALSYLSWHYLSPRKTKHLPTISRSVTPTTMDFKSQDVSNVKVSQIFIHPIKSCRGTSVQEAAYDVNGIKVQFDRIFAIIDAFTHKIVTGRDVHRMVLIHPRMEERPDTPDAGKLIVEFPAGSDCPSFSVPLCPSEETRKTWDIVNDITLWASTVDGYIVRACPAPDGAPTPCPSTILSRFLGRAVHLVRKGPRARACPPTHAFPALQATAVYQDGFPLLVASEESLAALQARVRAFAERGERGVQGRWAGGELEMERFRPNIVVRGAGVPWAEDTWETISVGQDAMATISLVSKCARCLLPNVDTETGVRDPAVPLKVLLSFRTGKDPARMSNACFGCNGVPSAAGVMRVGDRVRILKVSEKECW